AGVDVNARHAHDLTALMWAAGAGDAATVRALVQAGADPALKDDRGKTALDIAREMRRESIAEILSGLPRN
ncbi:MAG: ankyrin repeat domain-containing protein, partial [Burkholderiales bacterium]|nr:ankyrin repeat domain-containing protein [Burkholderiales bacterium]